VFIDSLLNPIVLDGFEHQPFVKAHLDDGEPAAVVLQYLLQLTMRTLVRSK